MAFTGDRPVTETLIYGPNEEPVTAIVDGSVVRLATQTKIQGAGGNVVHSITDGASVERLAVDALISAVNPVATLEAIIPEARIWPGTPVTFTDAAYTVAYTSTIQLLYQMVFQLDSDKVLMQLLVDGVVKMTIDIEEATNDFKFSGSSFDSTWLNNYSPGRWMMNFPRPAKAVTDVKLQFKGKTSGNKQLTRGITFGGTAV